MIKKSHKRYYKDNIQTLYDFQNPLRQVRKFKPMKTEPEEVKETYREKIPSITSSPYKREAKLYRDKSEEKSIPSVKESR